MNMSVEQERFNVGQKVTVVGSAVNIVLFLLKLGGGFFGHSQALIADAVHSLSDFVTDIVAFTGIALSQKEVDADHHYGHGKYETLAGAFIGLILFAVSFGLFWSSGEEVYIYFKGETLPRPAFVTVIIAAVSVLFKELLFHYTNHYAKKYDSTVLKANAWHHRSDALSSVAAIFGIGGAIFLGEKWRVLDPVAGICVSFMIFKVAFDILKVNINELLEASLPSEVESSILRQIRTVPGAESPHNLKTRKIGSAIAMEVHILVEPTLTIVEAHDIATRVEKRLHHRYGDQTFISIHVEPKGEE